MFSVIFNVKLSVCMSHWFASYYFFFFKDIAAFVSVFPGLTNASAKYECICRK